MTSVSGSGERLLAILDLFSEERPEWTPDEIMARLGYSRPTLYRYLKTLRDAGYLVSLPQAGLTLGPRVTELDFLMRRADPLIAAGQAHLAALAQRFPCSAFLVRWYGQRILCIASEVSAPEPRSSYPRGRPMPLGRGAISRAIIAFLPARERRALAAAVISEAAREEYLATLRKVRRSGVATAVGEVTPGVVGVAAPILVGDNAPVAALCVTSDQREMSDTRLTAIRAAVRDSAESISDHLRGLSTEYCRKAV